MKLSRSNIFVPFQSGSTAAQDTSSQEVVPYQQNVPPENTRWTPPPEASIGPRQQGPVYEEGYWENHGNSSGINALKQTERSEFISPIKGYLLKLDCFLNSIKEEEHASRLDGR